MERELTGFLKRNMNKLLPKCNLKGIENDIIL